MPIPVLASILYMFFWDKSKITYILAYPIPVLDNIYMSKAFQRIRIITEIKAP